MVPAGSSVRGLSGSGSGLRRGHGAGVAVPGRVVPTTVGRERGDPVPSTSVIWSCAPGCGPSFWAITRIPAGHMVGVGGESVDQPRHGRVGGDQAVHTLGLARTTAMSARQSPPNADAIARSTTILPGHGSPTACATAAARPTDPDQPRRFGWSRPAPCRRLTDRRPRGVDPQPRIPPGIVPHLESAPCLDRMFP